MLRGEGPHETAGMCRFRHVAVNFDLNNFFNS